VEPSGQSKPRSRSRAESPPLRPLAFIAAGVVITTAGHYLTPRDLLLWHGLFQRLYYLPVVYAAIVFGWRGGLTAAIVCGLAYLPHIVLDWSHLHHYALEQYAEIFMFLAVGAVTGILADRERRRRIELQHVYGELQSSFEQLRRADRLSAIGQLAAGLAHEIRNPLASIDGAAEVLSTSAGDGVRAETVGIIRKECGRLNRLLTSLLDFARPRRPERRLVDVGEVLQSVVDLIRHSAGKNIQFESEVAAAVPPLECDREQLTQVVLNLAINAAQAMPSGGLVRLRADSADGSARIQVIDNGGGVPETDLDRIFDPFFTTKESGTGLGLSVAYQIVTQHGGTITAERNRDRGMTFSIHLPTRSQPL
jgi:signal transduction histidine kinase